MMKYPIILIIALLATQTARAQSFAQLLADGKELVKTERAKYQKGDFSEAIEKLERAAKMRPNNQEVHYFLGSAYDYDNSADAQTMNAVNVDKTFRASKEFEKIIKISPKYDGEIVALDPYGKISSIWGSMAFNYLVKNKKDSARWAFSEGKRRGGFSDFAIAYYKEALRKCEKNAVYFSFGDFSTISMWYIQEMENVRPDVAVVSLSMIQIPWYTEYLYKRDPTLLSSAKIARDTTPYFEWTQKTLAIPVKNTGKKFEWDAKPTQQESYILRSDKIIMDIVKTSKFNRPIYFEKGSGSENMAGLGNYVKDNLVSDILVPDFKKRRDKDFYAYLDKYPFDIFKLVNVNSNVELFNVQMMRFELLNAISDLIEENKKADARKILKMFKKYLPEERFPYDDETIVKYMKVFEDKLN